MSSLTPFAAPAVEPLSVAEVMVHAQIDASNQEPPPGAITVALASLVATGNVNAGVHRYLATFVTATGETQAGEISAPISVADTAANGKIALADIPIGGALVTGRKIYRTAANGTVYLLLATLANNTDTTYTDNIGDASLGAQAPSVNTTDDWLLAMFIRSARTAVERITRRALITQTWDLSLDAFSGWTVHIPKPKLQSVTSISYVDAGGVTQVLDPSQYLVDTASEPGRITPVFGGIWPVTRWQNNAVTVRFVAGYGAAADVPAGIKSWMLMRIRTLWENRSQISVGTRLSIVELPSEFIDGLLDDFTVTNFAWAANS